MEKSPRKAKATFDARLKKKAAPHDGPSIKQKPPRMNRSRGQLSTVYAPGALFTFEGNMGACMSVPAYAEPVNLNQNTRDQIMDQIAEFVENWSSRAMSVWDGMKNIPNYKHPVDLRQVVDSPMIEASVLKIRPEKFAFVSPTQVGYVPFPLAFVCRACGLHKTCSDNLMGADKQIAEFTQDCPKAKCANDWEQLDVVMTHWSGSVEPLSSVRRRWDSRLKDVTTQSGCETCGEKRFYLIRKGTSFSEWYFECVNTVCRSRRDILQKDRTTLRFIGDKLETNDALPIEFNMEPVSYRASSVYYHQGDRLLDFSVFTYFDLLKKSKTSDLANHLAETYGYPTRGLTDEEKEELVAMSAYVDKLAPYKSAKAGIEAMSKIPMPEDQKELFMKPSLDLISTIEEIWEKEVFSQVGRSSPGIASKVAVRTDWIRRFDPIRMSIEHRTLEDERLNRKAEEDGKAVSVDVTEPDDHICPSDIKDAASKAMMIDEVRKRLALLGIEKMKLVRNLGVCEYSFAYSRTSPNPTVERDKGFGKMNLPVRLNLFDPPGQGENAAKNPIYTITQKNEAFYLKLDQKAVVRWLKENDIPVPDPLPSVKLGGFLIESYPDFSRFLDEYRYEGKSDRTAYPYVYTLLHTISHQFIEIASELSGLDMGSFGEHLFVPDLAILVYRRGTTMDLGNLSSMWRNYGNESNGNTVLNRMVNPETLRCGSETVCMMRGGACPDCILIPETSCITRNNLLSRSVLVGHGHPQWDRTGEDIKKGFYEVTREMHVGIPASYEVPVTVVTAAE